MSQRVNQQLLICTAASAQKVGLNEAILLQQIFYWQKKCGDSEWISNSYNTWKEQFKYLSRNTIRRTFASLVSQKLLECKRSQRCNFYRLRVDAVNKDLLDLMPPEFYIKAVPAALERQAIEEPKMEGTLQQMLDIWERKIPTAGQALSLTATRKIKLQTLFNTTFDSKLERWESFVDQIANSDFLMGKVTKFKVFLEWAIVPKNCTNILEGAYTKKVTDNNIAELDKVQKNISSHLDSIDNKDWRKTAKLLIQILGAPEYYSWFGKARFKKYENNCVYLEAETNFISNWIDDYYAHKIRRAWIEATNKKANSIVIKSASMLTYTYH